MELNFFESLKRPAVLLNSGGKAVNVVIFCGWRKKNDFLIIIDVWVLQHEQQIY